MRKMMERVSPQRQGWQGFLSSHCSTFGDFSEQERKELSWITRLPSKHVELVTRYSQITVMSWKKIVSCIILLYCFIKVVFCCSLAWSHLNRTFEGNLWSEITIILSCTHNPSLSLYQNMLFQRILLPYPLSF